MAETRRTIAPPPVGGRGPGVRAIGQRRAPFQDLYHYVLTRTWLTFFLLVGTAFVIINLLFAVVYRLNPTAIANLSPPTLETAFYFSVQTFATIGYGGMYPVTRFGHTIVTLEALASTLSVALITGMTFARFARPTARVLFSEKLVIAPRDGVPHLMMRMANWRHNQIVEAQLRVTLLVSETTREGDTMRVPLDLKLVRDRSAVFALSWSAMHKIDETSPFFGPDALDRLRQKKGEIFLTLTGYDQTVAGTVHARHLYALSDIVLNARFADVINIDPDGTRVINYHRFHDVVPIDETKT